MKNMRYNAIFHVLESPTCRKRYKWLS